MKITICDDSMEDMVYIEKLLYGYAGRLEEKFHRDFEVEKYTDSVKLYKKLEERKLSDVYILDMIMPVRSGIELGERVRSKAREPVIIYTTSSEEFALEAYRVHAQRYLVKPIEANLFYEAIEYAFLCTDRYREGVCLIKTKKGLIRIPYSQILYVENTARIIKVYLTGGKTVESIFIRNSFEKEMEELLGDPSFLQIHKSFIVHMRYVEKLTQDAMLMEGGVLVPVSKKKSADVKRKYLIYMTEKYRT